MPAAAKVSPKPLRLDPKPRHLDGSAVWARLKNTDPDKRYVYVNKGDSDAMATYDDAGYQVELLTSGGVCPAGGRTGRLNEPIEMRGMLLMSIGRQRAAEIEMHGADGDGGQAGADRLEETIVDRRGFDPLRGMHSRFITVENKIQAPENEVGP